MTDKKIVSNTILDILNCLKSKYCCCLKSIILLFYFHFLIYYLKRHFCFNCLTLFHSFIKQVFS